MSWSAFEELKSYASSIYGSKNKRKKEWNTPTTKRQRNSNQPSNVEEGSIDGFSSEEEKDKTCRSFSSSKERKNDHHHRKAKRKRTTTASETRKDLQNVIIDDIEDTPDDDKQERVLPSTSGQTVKTDQSPHGYHELEEVLDAMIKDFNSSDEEETVKDSEVHNIETLTPTPSSTLTPPRTTLPEKTPKTGSEWLKQVQHNMSSPNQDMPTSPDVKFDSAKKKQKFKRSGLAEQLQRIVNREKSEKSFWAHKQTAIKNELKGAADSTTALDVQVLSLHKQYSLHVTRCCVLSDKQESTAPYILDVVFNTPTMKQLALRVGCAIRIHPPWQKLHIPSSPYHILLCTYYCEMLPTPPGPPPVDVTSLPDLNWPRTKTDQGTSQLISSPKKSFQPSRLLFGDPETNEENSTHSESLTTIKTSQAKKTKKSLSIANVIEAQGDCSGGCVSFEAVVQRVYRRRVKVAREKAFDSPGDVFLSKTIVTRARSAEDKEETRVVLLLQDWSKNLCEVQIPEEFTFFKNWNSCIKMGIGKAYAFDDLRITQRTNRTRSPGLFNLIDSLIPWNSEEGDLSPEDKTSQIVSSDESTSQPSTVTSPPNYCYVLTVQDNSKVTSLDDYRHQGSSFLYTPPCLTNLQQLSRHNEDTPKRYAVWCRVICSRPNLRKSITRHVSNPPSWTGQILVTDTSLHRSFHCAPQESQDSSLPVRYVKLEVRASNVLSDSFQKAVCEAGTVLYIEDVAGSRKGLYADCYTTIKRGTRDPCQADIDKGDVQAIPISIYTELVGLRTTEFVPSLSSNTTSESLCKVQGVVHGVDEDSACCWLECATCGCQDLMERSGLPYYCPLCKADVHKPQTKTNLDIIMKCDSWKEGHVVIKLLQATIEQLLPVSYQDSDQGYDIDCVLGKCLGPLYCYVNEHTGSTARLDEISVSV